MKLCITVNVALEVLVDVPVHICNKLLGHLLTYTHAINGVYKYI